MSLHDEPAGGGRRATVRVRRATADAAVEARLRALGPALDGEPDPAFRATTRARLVAMAAVRTPAPAPTSGWRRLLALRADAAPRRRTRLTAALTGAALAVTALATLVAVSTGARPGDVLYGLKRGTEQTQLALAGDARGRTLLQFAGTRLSELDGLRRDGDTALAVATLHTMDQETTEGASWLATRAVSTHGTAPLDDLTGWTRDQRARLVAVQPQLPAGAHAAAAGSLDLLTRVAARADALTAALACPAGPATKGADVLGPLPSPCAAPPSGSSRSGAPGPPQASLPAPASVPPGGTAASGAGGSGGGSTGGSGSGTGAGSGAGSAPVGGPTGAPASTSPLINVPLPTIAPSLPGPQPTGSAGPTGSGGAAPVPGICLPPLVTIGNC